MNRKQPDLARATASLNAFGDAADRLTIATQEARQAFGQLGQLATWKRPNLPAWKRKAMQAARRLENRRRRHDVRLALKKGRR